MIENMRKEEVSSRVKKEAKEVTQQSYDSNNDSECGEDEARGDQDEQDYQGGKQSLGYQVVLALSCAIVTVLISYLLMENYGVD